MILDGERRTAPAMRQAENIPNAAVYRNMTDRGVSRVNGTVLTKISITSAHAHVLPCCSFQLVTSTYVPPHSETIQNRRKVTHTVPSSPSSFGGSGSFGIVAHTPTANPQIGTMNQSILTRGPSGPS